ncbi:MULTISPECIES: Lrp/AsnC family transcriptional regulator [Pseudoalteromonas]|uniref:AsnC family transcriptional regulator n=4 Tax=Pseudoalteromonas luteoviolacea TaxID=43657 RepID=A0A166VNR8_9GAMM|nr:MULTISPECIES: Lrp/AsnC family transcriptional regulator [Pseudoalteromonas]KZN30927.1 AsnC family transcriptional regulator [Pseudoalteromonas luteoviolacea S2607]KZN33225.1 AsnC family transcriptional regulator [Pseudoalteromonas luteoviolacea DSM 6061]KZN43003.1 AsnC family transcriptional regulator [Pseudoalteromonas luteoviolacea NCIMB 1942]KZN57120.1 AsnC family transcriptional regulator [Pseudoalteromonas luteoviolacea CPMOR-2]KZN62965.1 AsnC family transcriptional regulator [Pseudoal
MSLNQVDRQILALLQQDASLSTAEIADKVGLSQSPCWRRIAKLEQDGFIKGKVALLDEKQLGFDMLVYAHVKLSNHGRNNLAEFEKLIMSYDEVTECYTMAGTMDFMLRIISKGIEGYELFVRDNLLNLEYVQEVHSNVTMTCVKRSTALPII